MHTVSVFYDGEWLTYENCSPLTTLCMINDALAQGLRVKRDGKEIVESSYT